MTATLTQGIEAAGRTDIGRQRAANQDQFLIAELRRSLYVHATSLPEGDRAREAAGFGQLFAVADGVGGAQGGERASYLALDTLRRYAAELLPLCIHCDDDGAALEEELLRAVAGTQRRIGAEAQRHPGLANLSTTLTLVFVAWPRAWLVHLGDSRCYHLRGDELVQLTRDHTVAQDLAEEGVLSESGAERSRWKNVLSRSLGGGEGGHQPCVQQLQLEQGDALLLCSDGLTKHVEDEELRAALCRAEGVEQTCARLIDVANERGGTDNVTLVLARFGGGETPRLEA